MRKRSVSDVVLDSSALLAVINEEAGAETVLGALPGAYVSSVNVAEVVAKLNERGASEDKARLWINGLEVSVVPFDEEQAIQSGLLRRATKPLGLSLGDRACLALARSLDLPALTGDRTWAQLPLGVEVRLFR